MRSQAKAVVALSAVLFSLALGVTLAGAVAPVVTIDPASSVSYASAHVSGTVDPQDQETFYFFQYSKDAVNEGWSSGAFQGPIAAGAGVQNVSEDLNGLTPGSAYEVRLVAENFGDPAQTISAEPNPTFTTDPVGPPSVSIDPVTTFTGTSAHFSGAIDPEAPGGNPSAFDVSWRFECTPECPGLQGGQIAADSSSHVVEADASDLEPNTDYEVTLVASNAGGPVSDGPQSFKTATVAPVVQTLYAGELSQNEATLAAAVNPRNSPLTYQFEWGADTGYGNLAPAAPTALGAGDNAFHVVTAPLSGLQPGTTYHFRVVATNTDTSEVSEGLDHTFTTSTAPALTASCPNDEIRGEQGASHLPDCRAYERVSPQSKNHYNSMLVPGGTALSGSRAIWGVPGPVPGDASGSTNGVSLATRSTNGWISRVLRPHIPTEGGALPFVGVWSEDLTRTISASLYPLANGASMGAPNLFSRLETGAYQLITENTPIEGFGPIPHLYPQVAATTPDLSRVAYESHYNHTLDSTLSEDLNAFQWSAATGTELVGILPDPDGPGPLVESPAPDGARIGSGRGFGSVANAVSRDGERVFFHAIDLASIEVGVRGNSTSGQIYVRERHPSAPPTTRRLTVSERTDCAGDSSCGGDSQPDPAPDPAGPLPATYWTAEAEHGSKMLFTSCEKLTDDSTAFNPGGVQPACTRGDAVGDVSLGADLYLYDLDANEGTGDLVDLTTSDPQGASVMGVTGASDDLSRIYFVARGVLDDGAIQGAPNLYLWNEGATRFIATLASDGSGDVTGPDDADNWAISSTFKRTTTRVSPDGHKLLFVSRARLTGYDNQSPLCDTGRCAQTFVYDSVMNRLSCASCPPKGAASRGDAYLFGGVLQGDGWGSPRNLLADGTAFFQSPNNLLPEDSNGRLDVYRWKEGRLDLISGGSGAPDSYFYGASASGDDVFVLTADRLVVDDLDDLRDVYDARVDGGFPGAKPVPACEGDACLTPPVVPSDPTPGSSTFSSARNAASKPRCVKSKVRRKGRCIARRKHSKKNPAAGRGKK